MRPFKEVPQDLQESIDKLTQNELNVTDQCEYKHETADYHSPVIWIPKDDLGISEDEITHTKNYTSNIRISNDFADLDIKERMTVLQNIPKTDLIQ